MAQVTSRRVPLSERGLHRRRRMKTTLPLFMVLAAAGCEVIGDDTASSRSNPFDETEKSERCGVEPDLPYDVKIQCGDRTIPVLDAFREENESPAFVVAPGATPECPFIVEEATIRASEISSCAPFEATEADAVAPGNRDAGRDRVWVTWCWQGEDGVECAEDHLDIRFACDGGEGLAGGGEPLDPAGDVCDPGGGDDDPTGDAPPVD